MSSETSLLERAELLSGAGAASHAEVVAFLSDPASYPHRPDDVQVVETHTALVFLAGKSVYKLKRPILLDFVDCRSLEDRHRSCARELSINQRLAPGIYLETVPVTREPDGSLKIAGAGAAVDWLVVMRRVEASDALDRMVEEDRVTPADLDRICDTLSNFYRSQERIGLASSEWIDLWNRKIAVARRSLTDPLFGLPPRLTEGPLCAIEAFVSECPDVLAARLNEGRIVDGHGDLKPEHIYLSKQVLVIDRLEFDERLRWCDPFDEIVFLGLECSRLGTPWIGPMLVDKLASRMGERPPAQLLCFYRTYRGCMRARLMIEHLRDEYPRTPGLWPRKARAYLKLAAEALPTTAQS